MKYENGGNTKMTGQFLLLMLAASTLWIIECTSRTVVQRLRLEHAVLRHMNPEAARDAFRSVDFARHLAAVFLFRNPYKLYPSWFISLKRDQAWSVK